MLIDHVLVAARLGGDETPSAAGTAAGSAGECPPPLCAATTPQSVVNDAARLDAIDDSPFVDDWDAILRATDGHAEVRDGGGRSGERKRGD